MSLDELIEEQFYVSILGLTTMSLSIHPLSRENLLGSRKYDIKLRTIWRNVIKIA